MKILSVNKKSEIEWHDLKHIIISYINDFYSSGNELVIDDKSEENVSEFKEIEKKIIKILETKIRPAVARDGGDIKFNKFENGIVEVKLQQLFWLSKFCDYIEKWCPKSFDTLYS